MKKYIALCCVLSGMLFGCNESKLVLRQIWWYFFYCE